MNILDKRFKYVPAAKTDVGKTFKRVRQELRAKAQREREIEAEAVAKVRTMAGRK